MAKHRKNVTAYRHKLRMKYGQEFLDRLDTVYKKNSGISLRGIATEFSLTDVRIGQIFYTLHGIGYREARRIASESEDPDEDVSNGMVNLFVTVEAEMYRKLRIFTQRHGVSKASVVRDCLAGFLEDDAWGRIEL